MKKNRALRAIEFLENAPNNTLTEYELNSYLKTNWSPRAINEARKLDGVEITGSNPYTLVRSPLPKKPIRYEFDVTDNVARAIYQ